MKNRNLLTVLAILLLSGCETTASGGRRFGYWKWQEDGPIGDVVQLPFAIAMQPIGALDQLMSGKSPEEIAEGASAGAGGASSTSRPVQATGNSASAGEKPSREYLIAVIAADTGAKLMPFMGLIMNSDAQTLRALGDLCPESTSAQRAAVAKAISLIVEDKFLDEAKTEGGLAIVIPKLQAEAIRREPSVAQSKCLLAVIRDVVIKIITDPFSHPSN